MLGVVKIQDLVLENIKKESYCNVCQKELNIPKNIQNKLNNNGISKEEASKKILKKHTKDAHTITTGVKFKLILNNEQKNKLNEYFNEYAKAVTFCAKVIYRQRKYLKYMGKKENNKWEYPIAVCNYCGNNKEIYKQDQANAKKICKDCYNNEFGDNAIRKKMIPVRGKKERVEAKNNIHNATKKLSDTDRHLAFDDAINILKSLEQQKKEMKKRLIKSQKKLKYFRELYENPEKRYEVPLVGRQRNPRYLHKDIDKEYLNKKRGYPISVIKGKVKVLQRNIERDKKSIRKSRPIEFKGNRIKLREFDPKKIFNINENKVKLSFGREFLPKELSGWYNFYGTNVSNKHGKEYLLENLKKILEQEPKYSYLLRKIIDKDDNNQPIYDYFLQYTVETIPELKNSYSGILGIDAGVTNLATVVALARNDNKILCKKCKREHLKPTFVKFFSGSDIKSLKVKFRKQKHWLIGKHNKRTKIKKIRPIEPKVSEQHHITSKQIVGLAKSNNFAIALEKLEKPKKGKYIQSRRERYAVSLFGFKQLSDFIKYKSKREGINVIEIEPEGTSYTCSHCQNVSNNQRPYKKTNSKKPSYSLFKCGSCGIELNADYNAAFNIAQKGLNILAS